MIKNKTISKVLKTTGLLCIIAALLLTGYNLFTDFYYGKKANDAVSQIAKEVEVLEEETIPNSEEIKYQNLKSVEIDGEKYVGILEFPTLDLILPVLADATPASLNMGPGVYVGTPYNPNFVIAAHNRITFFTKILDLEIGDRVYFMDTYKNIFEYEVAKRDIIPPENIEEMISSNYDLSLFTCNFSNTLRETVRLTKVAETFINE